MPTIKKDPTKQKEIASLIKQATSRGRVAGEPEIHHIMPKEAIPEGATESERMRALAQFILFGTHDWYITRAYLPDETKLDWHGWQCRSHWFDFYGHLSHPDIDSIMSDVNACMGAAVVAAIGAGFAAGVGAATAAFKGSLYLCLKAKGISWADEISIWITSVEGRGDWHYCL